jgi:hypothetical protein
LNLATFAKAQLPKIVLVWLTGVLLLSIRLLFGWLRAHAMARRNATVGLSSPTFFNRPSNSTARSGVLHAEGELSCAVPSPLLSSFSSQPSPRTLRSHTARGTSPIGATAECRSI